MLAEEASYNPNQMGSTSLEVALTSGVQESLTILIPDGAIAHSGLLAITSDSDGFDSSINIGVMDIKNTHPHLTNICPTFRSPRIRLLRYQP